MTHKRISLTLALVAATLALPTVATAQCTPFGFGLYYADLIIGQDVNVSFYQPPAAAGPHVVGSITDPIENCPTHQALLEVTLPDGCTEATLLFEYQGTPTGWTINVGDSPTNNGFGGNGGGPENDAELQILDETLTVYSKGLGPGIVDLLAQDHMGLTDGALEIVVRDQYVSWGQPFSSLDTANSGLLFAFPDAESPDPNTFYVGINRVVSDPGDRTGCGVHRVLVSFR